jgi:hypothetical protein
MVACSLGRPQAAIFFRPTRHDLERAIVTLYLNLVFLAFGEPSSLSVGVA